MLKLIETQTARITEYYSCKLGVWLLIRDKNIKTDSIIFLTADLYGVINMRVIV